MEKKYLDKLKELNDLKDEFGSCHSIEIFSDYSGSLILHGEIFQFYSEEELDERLDKYMSTLKKNK